MKHIGQIIDQQIREWEIHREKVAKKEETEKRPVICISRDLGSGARIVAKKLADDLGFSLLGRDTIDYIAADLHTQRRLVDTLDEQGKQRLERWIDGYLHGQPVEYDEYAKSLIKVLRTAGMQGNVVILGRGGAYILGTKEAFCVRLVAPYDVRVQRLMSYDDISKSEAEERIHRADKERVLFLRRIFHTDVNELLAFHITLNMGVISPDQAVSIIKDSMKTLGYHFQPVGAIK